MCLGMDRKEELPDEAGEACGAPVGGQGQAGVRAGSTLLAAGPRLWGTDESRASLPQQACPFGSKGPRLQEGEQGGVWAAGPGFLGLLKAPASLVGVGAPGGRDAGPSRAEAHPHPL